MKAAAIYEQLAARISAGDLAPGARLPAERELATVHGVARETVRSALGVLEQRGLIQRGVGRGTFVAEHGVARDLTRLAGFSEQLRGRGVEPGARVRCAREVRAVPAEVRAALDLAGPALRIQRVRTGDGAPLALEDSWLPAALFPGFAAHDLTGSLYALMRDAYDLEPVRATEALEPVVAGSSEARLLRLEPGAPLLAVERTAWAADGRAVEYARDRFRGARFVVEVAKVAFDD